MKKQKLSYEDAVKELEEIVDRLERGELTLDESIDSFQKGIELSRYCSKRLDEVEKKIVLLLEDKDGHCEETVLDSAEMEAE